MKFFAPNAGIQHGFNFEDIGIGYHRRRGRRLLKSRDDVLSLGSKERYMKNGMNFHGWG
jgi:hypothetical protein